MTKQKDDAREQLVQRRRAVALQTTLAAGQMLGRYELLLPIAAGGMGHVWAARLKGTRGFRKLVAIKTILRHFDDPRLEQMLFQEATLASQIHHPNVVETIELGEEQGTMYLAMELIQGESLAFIVREAFAQGGLPIAVAVNLIGQVCKGLQAAHDLCDETGAPVGLVHRDVSPPNILVTYSGTVKIVDFGVATTSSSATCGSGEIKGKISYLAPEQLRSDVLDGRVDVFAAGIVLYLLTVGRHPFKGTSDAQTISRVLSDTPAPPPSSIVEDYPPELEQVVLKALEKDRDGRWQSAREFRHALEDVMPEAFGPAGDQATSEYISELLRDRMVERRATLRMAEELAENSTRDSVLSVPGMVAAAPPPAVRGSSRSLVMGALGALGVAALALGAFQYGPRLRALHGGQSANVSALHDPMAPRTPTAAAAPAARSAPALVADPSAAAGAATSMTEQVAGSAPVTTAAARLAAVHRERGGRSRGGDDAAAHVDVSAESELVPDLSALGTAPDAPSPSVEPVRVMALTPAAVVPVPRRPVEVKPTGPRTLSSRLGHGRLAVNPNADGYRVKIPPALERTGERFSAMVKICVSPAGKVTDVAILRSAGPAIDAQIPSTLRRWSYRPLTEDGKAVPFCYPLNYQIGGR